MTEPKTPDLAASIAAEVRAEMAFQKLSIPQLADLLNISTQSARRRYSGELDYSLDEIEAVADWLGVSRAQLLLGLPRQRTAVAS